MYRFLSCSPALPENTVRTPSPESEEPSSGQSLKQLNMKKYIYIYIYVYTHTHIHDIFKLMRTVSSIWQPTFIVSRRHQIISFRHLVATPPLPLHLQPLLGYTPRPSIAPAATPPPPPPPPNPAPPPPPWLSLIVRTRIGSAVSGDDGVYARICVCVHVSVCTRICVFTYLCIHVSVCTCVCCCPCSLFGSAFGWPTVCVVRVYIYIYIYVIH